MAAFLETRINEHGGAYNVRVQEGPDGRYVGRTVDWYGPHFFELSIFDPINEARRERDWSYRYQAVQ